MYPDGSPSSRLLTPPRSVSVSGSDEFSVRLWRLCQRSPQGSGDFGFAVQIRVISGFGFVAAQLISTSRAHKLRPVTGRQPPSTGSTSDGAGALHSSPPDDRTIQLLPLSGIRIRRHRPRRRPAAPRIPAAHKGNLAAAADPWTPPPPPHGASSPWPPRRRASCRCPNGRRPSRRRRGARPGPGSSASSAARFHWQAAAACVFPPISQLELHSCRLVRASY